MNDIAIPCHHPNISAHIYTLHIHMSSHTHTHTNTHKHTHANTAHAHTCKHAHTQVSTIGHGGIQKPGGGGLILLKGRGVLFSHGGARDSVAHQSTLVRSRASPAVTIKSSFSCMQFQNVNRMHQVHTVTVAIMAMVAKQ